MTTNQRAKCVPTDQEILETAIALSWNLACGPRAVADNSRSFEHAITCLLAWHGMSKRERRVWAEHLDSMPQDIGAEAVAWARGIDGKERSWAQSDNAFRKARLLKSRYQVELEGN